MNHYTISKNADSKIFKHVLSLIFSEFKEVKIGKYAEDFDGSQIQLLLLPNGKIFVYNHYEVDAVYIESEINLDEFIKKHFEE